MGKCKTKLNVWLNTNKKKKVRSACLGPFDFFQIRYIASKPVDLADPKSTWNIEEQFESCDGRDIQKYDEILAKVARNIEEGSLNQYFISPEFALKQASRKGSS
jgi:hypothetical protein